MLGLGLGLGLGAMEPHSTADMPSMDQAHVAATLDAQGMPQAEHMMHRARGEGLSMRKHRTHHFVSYGPTKRVCKASSYALCGHAP